jgi:hypothetical protein
MSSLPLLPPAATAVFGSYLPSFESLLQGVTKRCRLSWLTNSALLYQTNYGGRAVLRGIEPMRTAVHRIPNKLCRSNSIFNLCSTLSTVSRVRACLSISLERFRGTQKEDERGQRGMVEATANVSRLRKLPTLLEWSSKESAYGMGG